MTLAFDASFRRDPSQKLTASAPLLHAGILAWSTTEMDSDFDSRRQEMSAADEVRPILAELVREAEVRCRSRMLAYIAVGRLIRIGEGWVRRMIGGQVKGFDADVYKRILLAEQQLRARRIAEAETLLARERARSGSGEP